MIYDCFSFFNELDVLELRLNILKDVVDKFVLVESVWTHQGATKELIYEKNRERFSAFNDRIIHVAVKDAPVIPRGTPKLIVSWAHENFQRNAVIRGLVGAKPDDMIIISDLDEIPNPEKIAACIGQKGLGGFEQLPMRYFLNFQVTDTKVWVGSKILSYADFVNPKTYEGMASGIVMPEFVNSGPTATRVRMLRPTYRIANGGWHFGYYGGPKMVLKKLCAIADFTSEKNLPCDEATIRQRMMDGKDPLNRYCGACAVPLDGRFPKYVLENQDKYSDGILPCKHVSLKGRIMFIMMPMKCKIVESIVTHIPSWIKPFAYFIYSHCVRNPIPLMKDQLAQN